MPDIGFGASVGRVVEAGEVLATIGDDGSHSFALPCGVDKSVQRVEALAPAVIRSREWADGKVKINQRRTVGVGAKPASRLGQKRTLSFGRVSSGSDSECDDDGDGAIVTAAQERAARLTADLFNDGECVDGVDSMLGCDAPHEVVRVSADPFNVGDSSDECYSSTDIQGEQYEGDTAIACAEFVCAVAESERVQPVSHDRGYVGGEIHDDDMLVGGVEAIAGMSVGAKYVDDDSEISPEEQQEMERTVAAMVLSMGDRYCAEQEISNLVSSIPGTTPVKSVSSVAVAKILEDRITSSINDDQDVEQAVADSVVGIGDQIDVMATECDHLGRCHAERAGGGYHSYRAGSCYEGMECCKYWDNGDACWGVVVVDDSGAGRCVTRSTRVTQVVIPADVGQVVSGGCIARDADALELERRLDAMYSTDGDAGGGQNPWADVEGTGHVDDSAPGSAALVAIAEYGGSDASSGSAGPVHVVASSAAMKSGRHDTSVTDTEAMLAKAFAWHREAGLMEDKPPEWSVKAQAWSKSYDGRQSSTGIDRTWSKTVKELRDEVSTRGRSGDAARPLDTQDYVSPRSGNVYECVREYVPRDRRSRLPQGSQGHNGQHSWTSGMSAKGWCDIEWARSDDSVEVRSGKATHLCIHCGEHASRGHTCKQEVRAMQYGPVKPSKQVYWPPNPDCGDAYWKEMVEHNRVRRTSTVACVLCADDIGLPGFARVGVGVLNRWLVPHAYAVLKCDGVPESAMTSHVCKMLAGVSVPPFDTMGFESDCAVNAPTLRDAYIDYMEYRDKEAFDRAYIDCRERRLRCGVLVKE